MNTANLNAAIAKAKLEFPQILANRTVNIKTKTGREIKFTYAELEEILEAVTPVLSSNGLCLVSQMQYLPNGKFVLQSTLRHESGECIESCFPLPESAGDAKDLGAQIAYGRRYNAMCLLEISTVEPSNQQQFEEQTRKLAHRVKGEMNQIPDSAPVKKAVIPAPEIDRDLVNSEIASVLKRKNFSIEEAKAMIFEKFGVRSRAELNDEQLVQLLETLRMKPSTATV